MEIKKIFIEDPKGFIKMAGRLFKVGGKRFFVKFVVREKHFMRVVGGYGIQKEVFDKYLRRYDGGVFIFERVKSSGERNIYYADLDVWREKSHCANYGAGKQVFLGIKYMKEPDKEKIKLLLGYGDEK